MVMGGIVPVLNVAGIAPGQLVLDGPTLARIFLGNIKTWNDPAIAKLNPGVKLPGQAILVFLKFGSGQRRVRGAERNRLGFDLLDAAT
jgi:phosphate transport system substrate-binding protein